jgi:hypothetical protein
MCPVLHSSQSLHLITSIKCLKLIKLEFTTINQEVSIFFKIMDAKKIYSMIVFIILITG